MGEEPFLYPQATSVFINKKIKLKSHESTFAPQARLPDASSISVQKGALRPENAESKRFSRLATCKWLQAETFINDAYLQVAMDKDANRIKTQDRYLLEPYLTIQQVIGLNPPEEQEKLIHFSKKKQECFPEFDSLLIQPRAHDYDNSPKNIDQIEYYSEITLSTKNFSEHKKPQKQDIKRISNLENLIKNQYDLPDTYKNKDIEGIYDLEPIMAQHDDFLGQLINDQLHPGKPVVLQPTAYVALSAVYAERIRLLAKGISPVEVAQAIGLIQVGPLVTAVMDLGAALSDKTKQPSKQVREKAQKMIAVYQQTTDQESVIGQLFEKDALPVQVFDPFTESIADLNRMLSEGGACTAQPDWQYTGFDKKEIRKKESVDWLKNSPADLMMQDSQAGGSVHYQVKNGRHTSYNRMYIGVSPDGEPFLFHDVIESRGWFLSKPEDYLSSHKGDLLMSSFAAAIIIANRLGISRVVYGDDELLKVAQSLGFGEKRVFGEGSNLVQKLGFVCSSTHREGPYAWRMGGRWVMDKSRGGDDKSFRTVVATSFEPKVLEAIAKQAQDVMNRVKESPRSIKTFRSDYETYFGMVGEIMRVNGRALDELSSFCADYKISPLSLEPIPAEQVVC
ncbi:MAG: hypothetical protein ABIJ21_02270 [Nanoarchaeota archaeon]